MQSGQNKLGALLFGAWRLCGEDTDEEDKESRLRPRPQGARDRASCLPMAGWRMGGGEPAHTLRWPADRVPRLVKSSDLLSKGRTEVQTKCPLALTSWASQAKAAVCRTKASPEPLELLTSRQEAESIEIRHSSGDANGSTPPRGKIGAEGDLGDPEVSHFPSLLR